MPRAIRHDQRTLCPTFSIGIIPGNVLHPTQKPLSALIPLVLAFTKPGDTILDPFCGSGSSLVAAALLGRHSVGIEVDGRYVAVANERLRNMRRVELA